jgi:hypothetical protein
LRGEPFFGNSHRRHSANPPRGSPRHLILLRDGADKVMPIELLGPDCPWPHVMAWLGSAGILSSAQRQAAQDELSKLRGDGVSAPAVLFDGHTRELHLQWPAKLGEVVMLRVRAQGRCEWEVVVTVPFSEAN